MFRLTSLLIEWMMMWRKVLLIFGVLVLALFLRSSVVKADVNCDGTSNRDECLNINKQIEDLTKQLQMSQQATTPLEQQITKFDAQIKSIQSQINAAAAKQKDLEAGIAKREGQVAEHYVLLAKKTRELYKKKRSSTILTELLSSMGAGQLKREIEYQTMVSEQDRQLIIVLSTEIISLDEDKKNIDAQKEKLAALQSSLDKQASFFKGEVAKAKNYQAVLSGQIAALSARQQEIINEKQGTFSTTVGDVPLADDPASRPDYNPGFSPAFAAFSFGAPHFKGMSQYGAFGRAKSGQNYETILHAYYGNIEIKRDYDQGKQIGVEGYGRMSIETYMKRIYEVPNSWGDEGGYEALKAQAIAARSYALAWTDEGRGGAICTTQACQVYKNSDKGGNWERAVNETKGMVLWNNGKPFKAWFASTSGGYQESYTDSYSGYTTPGFWDTPSGRGGWTSQAYEKTAGSPWFYKGWYRGSSGDSCGRNHPWLTGEEMADILNAWVILIKNGQSDDRVTPQGSCWGGNPYSLADLRSKASGMGGGYSSVSGVSVSYSDGGYTAKVHFDTDKGSVDIDGDDFKKAFNLRAPGRIALKSGLFNIEKK